MGKNFGREIRGDVKRNSQGLNDYIITEDQSNELNRERVSEREREREREREKTSGNTKRRKEKENKNT